MATFIKSKSDGQTTIDKYAVTAHVKIQNLISIFDLIFDLNTTVDNIF